MALDEHMESVSIVYFCQVFKLGVFTTPSMNEFFDTKEYSRVLWASIAELSRKSSV